MPTAASAAASVAGAASAAARAAEALIESVQGFVDPLDVDNGLIGHPADVAGGRSCGRAALVDETDPAYEIRPPCHAILAVSERLAGAFVPAVEVGDETFQLTVGQAVDVVEGPSGSQHNLVDGGPQRCDLVGSGDAVAGVAT